LELKQAVTASDSDTDRDFRARMLCAMTVSES
jgi:hypothetical protein